MRAVVITGAPGVGKTSFARALAEGMGGRLIEYYAHHWTSDEDMFLAVDPARVAAIAGGHEMPLCRRCTGCLHSVATKWSVHACAIRERCWKTGRKTFESE